ncbi:MAG: DUF2513 domain-containing protein [Candidatus Angelobacter sp.]
MKRDMDLVRLIMLEVEKNPDPMAWADINIPGYTDLDISYHIKLLDERGLVEANNLSRL